MAKNTSKGPGRPRKERTTQPTKAAAKNTKEGEEKYIIIAKTGDIEAMKNIAYWDRLTIKEVFAQAIADRVTKFERRHGTLKARP